MFYSTKINDTTNVLMEAEAGGAFAKNDLEELPDPDTALLRMINLVGDIGKQISAAVGAKMQGGKVDFEVEFGTRADASGTVMLAQRPGDGQFRVRIVGKA